SAHLRPLHSFPTRRSSDLLINRMRYKRIRWAAMEFLLKSQKRNRRRLIIEQLILLLLRILLVLLAALLLARYLYSGVQDQGGVRSEEHTSELQSLAYLVCR